MSATTEINNAATATAQYQASQPRLTGAASKLGSQEFMNLMMKQLQYQDPMEPVSNTEFIAQQAQFSQLSTTQDISASLAASSASSQAASLVGQHVTLTNPDDKTKTISGEVTSATMKGANSAITVNGKSYALSYLKSVDTPESAAAAAAAAQKAAADAAAAKAAKAAGTTGT